MKKFEFRLQKVLEYRQAMENWAQEAYLETRVARLEAEAVLSGVDERRKECLHRKADTLEARQLLEITLQSLDDDEKAQILVIDVLKTEEEKALNVWQEKKRELETIVKLRDKSYEDWKLEETRREQAELDEWAVLRRGA
ncbi:MAG TPA: flagellar FliJ family protein [Fimbriimonadaceae bacterium]|nr:flagellar FliJ family protein [Fimbriimonadaceae bacterium]